MVILCKKHIIKKMLSINVRYKYLTFTVDCVVYSQIVYRITCLYLCRTISNLCGHTPSRVAEKFFVVSRAQTVRKITGNSGNRSVIGILGIWYRIGYHSRAQPSKLF